MNSEIQELYEVAQEFARNANECSLTQFVNSLLVIELIEDGDYDKAVKVGLVY